MRRLTVICWILLGWPAVCTAQQRVPRFERLLQEGQQKISQGKVSEGQALFKKLIAEHQASGDILKQAEVWYRFGKSYLTSDSHFYISLTSEKYASHALNCFTRSLDLARSIGNAELQTRSLIVLGDFYTKSGKLDQAEKAYLQIVELQKGAGRPIHQNPQAGLMVVHYFRGNFNKALFYGLGAIRNADLTGNRAELDELYFYLGNVYRDLGQSQNSVKAYEKALLEVKRKNNRSYIHAYVLKNLVRQLIAQGRTQDAAAMMQKHLALVDQSPDVIKMLVAETRGHVNQALGNTQLAETQFKRMIHWALQLSDPVRALPSYLTMGEFYFKNNRYPLAAQYLGKLIDAPQGQIPVSVRSRSHYILFKVDSAAGNYLGALGHLGQHKALNDSIFNETKSKQINELQIRFETEQKEQNIKLLQSSAALHTNEIAQARFARNITYVVMLLLALIALLLYRGYHLKQKSNEALLSQQIDISRKNKSLQLLLSEKEWLLREVHHRVKNNLQVVISLLNIQSAYLDSEAALSAIRQSQFRINAMSLIHQKLYQSETISTISMDDYIGELVRYLRDSLGVDNRITFNIRIENQALAVTQAVSIGLILNEAITNAIKHSFPRHTSGEITVSLAKTSRGTLSLTVDDNGVGLPAGISITDKASVGINLIQILTEQLDGHLEITSDHGLRISIEFQQELTEKANFQY
jgi:two-component sensor histidine kinase